MLLFLNLFSFMCDLLLDLDVLFHFLSYLFVFNWTNSLISLIQFRENDSDQKLELLRAVCSRLPNWHLNNLRYLIRFLDRLSQSCEANKMSSQNIAMSLTPSLIWSPPSTPVESCRSSTDVNGMNPMDMTSTNLHSVIIYSLVSNALSFFPGGMSCLYSITLRKSREHCISSWDSDPLSFSVSLPTHFGPLYCIILCVFSFPYALFPAHSISLNWSDDQNRSQM